MATHSSILAWRIPWTEEPGRLQSMGSRESDMTYLLKRERECVYVNSKLPVSPPSSSALVTLSLCFVCVEQNSLTICFLCVNKQTKDKENLNFTQQWPFPAILKVFSVYFGIKQIRHCWGRGVSPWEKAVQVWRKEGQGELCGLDSSSQICLLKELWGQGRPNGPKHSQCSYFGSKSHSPKFLGEVAHSVKVKVLVSPLTLCDSMGCNLSVSSIKKYILHRLKGSLHKVFNNYKGKKGSFIVGKFVEYHLNHVIKISTREGRKKKCQVCIT